MRLRPEQHLRRSADIRAVREQGGKVDCRAFSLWWRAQRAAPDVPAAPATRFCVIASTHAVGRAVQRNRAKRRLREVFRRQQASVPAGCDFVLVARRGSLEWPQTELDRRFVAGCADIARSRAALS